MKHPLYNSPFVKRVIGLLILLALAFATGCVSVVPSSPANTSPPFFMNSASPTSSQEADLYRWLLILSAGVFLVVEGLLLYNIIRFRAKKGTEGLVPEQKYREHLIEAIYTAVPVVIVITIFFLMLNTMNAVAVPAPAPNDLKLQVVGHRWWWEFDYPDLNIKTANELHIPVDTTVQVDLSSFDVIHSFYVPQLNSKTDVIPGIINHTWLHGDVVGQFHGQCSEYCGLNHANMRFTVVVESKADFDDWVANQQKPPAEPQTEQQKAGFMMITEGICSMCHTLGDNGPGNATAPDLTHLMSRQRFAGDIFTLNQENLRRWLEDTEAMKPGNDMDHKFTREQIDALMSYLLTLK